MEHLAVIADVGGTNIRLACYDMETGRISQTKKYLCADHGTISDVLRLYFAELNGPVVALSIAIACPVDKDRVEMTNHSWTFSKAELKQTLGLDTLFVINDYTAISLAIPFIEKKDLIKIGRGEAGDLAAKAIFGPGTGLGVSHLMYDGRKWVSLDGEGGHADFAPNSETEMEIWRRLHKKFGHVSVERLLSGSGLVNIYQALADMKNGPAIYNDAASISTNAIEQSDKICHQALEVFCDVMGSFGGNLALNMGTTGGVYIAGGIVPRFVEFFKSSGFRSAFESKGRFNAFNASIATYIVTHDDPGLLGAGVYLKQELS